MDFNRPPSYKPSTLSRMKTDCFRMAAHEYEMDKEIWHLIDTLEELLPAPEEKLADDVLICECFCISVGDIRETCLNEVDLDLLADRFNMGQGCQSCIKNKVSWIHKVF